MKKLLKIIGLPLYPIVVLFVKSTKSEAECIPIVTASIIFINLIVCIVLTIIGFFIGYEYTEFGIRYTVFSVVSACIMGLIVYLGICLDEKKHN